MSVRILQNKCVGCGKCLSVCPGNLLKKGEDGKVHIRNIRDCWGCTACLKECHTGAILYFLGADMGGMDSMLSVKEKGDDIVFLRKIVKGGADKSYGIQVAKLAGVPDSVIARAKELVEELSQADISVKAKSIAEESQAKAKQKAKPKKYDEVDLEQISLFDAVKDDDVVKELQELDISNMTPMDAMNTLYRLQNKLKNRWQS